MYLNQIYITYNHSFLRMPIEPF
ncbi:hypothetical protein F383_22164 [Gossypium arboreum]|uniref:Uncharacterized protein n=1 Tax=Gossypium arboreum TaxID=29729 RepID=A0A0B0NWT0_GOSAR|nr:hypothetical protein F383_22164 [Gossypium arboreum]